MVPVNKSGFKLYWVHTIPPGLFSKSCHPTLLLLLKTVVLLSILSLEIALPTVRLLLPNDDPLSGPLSTCFHCSSVKENCSTLEVVLLLFCTPRQRSPSFFTLSPLSHLSRHRCPPKCLLLVPLSLSESRLEPRLLLRFSITNVLKIRKTEGASQPYWSLGNISNQATYLFKCYR